MVVLMSAGDTPVVFDIFFGPGGGGVGVFFCFGGFVRGGKGGGVCECGSGGCCGVERDRLAGLIRRFGQDFDAGCGRR